MCKLGIGTFFGALTFSLLLLLLLSLSLASAELTPPLPDASTYIDIGVEKAHEMLAENPAQIILLDVRTEGEYNAEYIPMPGVELINIPLDKLETEIGKLNRSKAVIVYCKSVSRSRTASETLTQQGFENVYNMLGGINAWKEMFATSIATPMPAQTPAVTPSPAVSPEFTPTASPTPTTAPILTPTPEKEKRVPGFEATLAILMLLILFMLLRRKRK